MNPSLLIRNNLPPPVFSSLANQGVASGQVHVAGTQPPAVGEAGVGVLATESRRLKDPLRGIESKRRGRPTHLCAFFGAFVEEVEGARPLHPKKTKTKQDLSLMTTEKKSYKF